MDYIILLNLHVTAVIVWILSMLVISISVSASADYTSATPGPWISRMRLVGRFVTTPFMVLAWILGITLAIRGGWFGANWLSAKLVFVLVLSAVHGIQSKTLRVLSTSPQHRISLFVRLFPVIIVVCGLMIVALAMTKPF